MNRHLELAEQSYRQGGVDALSSFRESVDAARNGGLTALSIDDVVRLLDDAIEFVESAE